MNKTIYTHSSCLDAFHGQIVKVESIMYNQKSSITITGMAGHVIKESKERIQGYLQSINFETPTFKTVINLSPAEIQKQGSHFDLSMALCLYGLETKEKKVFAFLARSAFVGEITLSGEIKKTNALIGLLDPLISTPEIKEIIISQENEEEACLLESPKLKVASHINQILKHISNPKEYPLSPPQKKEVTRKKTSSPLKIKEIKHQEKAKKALQISLAGGHHLLLIGSPGVGKTLLGQMSEAVLKTQPLKKEQRRELMKIYSLRNLFISEELDVRPFRAPHHTSTPQALLGGGQKNTLYPGEISLSHHGVLFLDEFPEYQRKCVEGLREALEYGEITLSRSGQDLKAPARFTLIATMNPCPCGYAYSSRKTCRCSQDTINKYLKRISGPIMDRIDLCVWMEEPKTGEKNIETTEWIDKLNHAYLQQLNQSPPHKFLLNGWNRAIEKNLSTELQGWLQTFMTREQMSYRQSSRMVRVAQTIADIEGRNQITHDHLVEAWSFQCGLKPS